MNAKTKAEQQKTTAHDVETEGGRNRKDEGSDCQAPAQPPGIAAATELAHPIGARQNAKASRFNQ